MDKTSFLALLTNGVEVKEKVVVTRNHQNTYYLVVKLTLFELKFLVKIVLVPTDRCNSNRNTKVVLKTFFGPKPKL